MNWALRLGFKQNHTKPGEHSHAGIVWIHERGSEGTHTAQEVIACGMLIPRGWRNCGEMEVAGGALLPLSESKEHALGCGKPAPRACQRQLVLQLDAACHLSASKHRFCVSWYHRVVKGRNRLLLIKAVLMR